jgi:hypothetical protein
VTIRCPPKRVNSTCYISRLYCRCVWCLHWIGLSKRQIALVRLRKVQVWPEPVVLARITAKFVFVIVFNQWLRAFVRFRLCSEVLLKLRFRDE